MRGPGRPPVHDTEPDTFEPLTLQQEYALMLRGIGVEASAKEAGADEVEKTDYYSRYHTSAPRMITNRGCVELAGSKVDLVHIVQKG